MDKLLNFKNTLKELKNYLSLPIHNNRDRAGVIQAFEFTFEQSWKAIQKLASEKGVEVASPKAAFTFALQNQWIEAAKEPRWIQMIKDRNVTSHTYHQDLAKEILGRISVEYVLMFESLLTALEEQG